MKKLYFIFFLFSSSFLFGQKLTGTWVGDIDGYEFLQVNLVQVGNNICGYSWDYVYNRKDDYCKQYITGNRNINDNTWFLNGYSFMDNHFNHSLMQFKFKLIYEDRETYLIGLVRIKPNLFFSGGEPSEIRLKKISNKPAEKTKEMEDCLKSKKEDLPAKKIPEPVKKPTVEPKKIINKPILKPSKQIPTTKVIKKDTLTTPVIIKTTPKENSLPTKIEGRPNKEIKRIIVNERKITLNVYDNGTVDGDTVTILYNGKAIISHKKISEKPLTVELELDENTKYHSIVLFAENLGSIPPNTALLIFTTPSKKRYELFASANLQQNAEIIFEYKPN